MVQKQFMYGTISISIFTSIFMYQKKIHKNGKYGSYSWLMKLWSFFSFSPNSSIIILHFIKLIKFVKNHQKL